MDGKQFTWYDMDSRFAEQMRRACLTPSHRIAIAVSGGADSIALCLLIARWKRLTLLHEGCGGQGYGELVGYVVDHSLRKDSAEEALRVKEWVCSLGLNCEILKCKWLDGKPSTGHLQEAARYARYSLLSQACLQSGIQTLLTAHHADDQTELFILRVSRRSEIAGLAGMAFAADLNSVLSIRNCRSPVILIRPLLRFTKQELYAVCRHSYQAWVEDPTNANLAFARNRIRKALQEPQYLLLKKELPKLIEYCRKMRFAVDRDRDVLLREVAQISQEFGTMTLDVQKLAFRGLSDLATHRAVASILQFVAQRAKPPRGRAVEMLLDRLRLGSLKGACTVGGCHIFPLSGSKGSRAIICFSPDSPPPSGQLEAYTQQLERQHISSTESCGLDMVKDSSQRISVLGGADLIGETDLNDFSSEALRMTRPPRRVRDFKSLGLLSEEGASLLEKLSSDVAIDTNESSVEQHMGNPSFSSTVTDRMIKRISFEESQYFMNRFCVSLNMKGPDFAAPSSYDKSQGYCALLQERPSLLIRHFKDSDAEYLSDLVAGRTQKWTQCCNLTCRFPTGKMPRAYSETGNRQCSHTRGQQTGEPTTPFKGILRHQICQKSLPAPSCNRDSLNSANWNSIQMAGCDSHRVLKAKEALAVLKGIPKPVRRSLPVLTTSEGLLLGLPFAGFCHCKRLSITARFSPRSALGGGQASWQ